ncbi:hypothetical protein J7M23_09615 [Candidatus Sumerlaeota bacterium]|nr:hypothetical protein [Candidatus Sumerlaeota bacterium]
MRFVNQATKRGWKRTRWVQRFPFVTIVREEYENPNPVSGVLQKTEQKIKVPVTIHLITSKEIETSGGFFEIGDIRISAYETIKPADEVEYNHKRYRVIEVHKDPLSNRYNAVIRRI